MNIKQLEDFIAWKTPSHGPKSCMSAVRRNVWGWRNGR